MAKEPNPAPTDAELRAAGVEVIEPFTVTEEPLEGEGKDRLFVTKKGTRLRAKLTVSDRRMTLPNTDGVDVIAAPTAFTLRLSLAELTPGNAVKKAGDKFLIHDAHEIPITEEMMAHPDFDLETVIMRTIRDESQRVERVADKKSSTMSILKSKWGLEI